MTMPAQLAETAKAGADSVYRYVERTAEVEPDGVRWQTLTLENEPTYAAALVNGAAGISLFLSDYYRLTGTPRARATWPTGVTDCANNGPMMISAPSASAAWAAC